MSLQSRLAELITAIGADIKVAKNSITSEATNAAPIPTGFAQYNQHTITALAAAAVLGVPSGTLVNGNRLIIRIKDNGTARGISYNAVYRAVGVTLPITTVLSKTLYLGAVYNSTDSRWDIIAVGQEA